MPRYMGDPDGCCIVVTDETFVFGGTPLKGDLIIPVATAFQMYGKTNRKPPRLVIELELPEDVAPDAAGDVRWIDKADVRVLLSWPKGVLKLRDDSDEIDGNQQPEIKLDIPEDDFIPYGMSPWENDHPE